MLYRIREAATRVGETRHVLRFWEEQFGLRVERSRSGHRIYSVKNLADLLTIKALLREEKFTIEGAKEKLAAAQRALKESA
jgi:DNA-binding transcriptional MerR regulator